MQTHAGLPVLPKDDEGGGGLKLRFDWRQAKNMVYAETERGCVMMANIDRGFVELLNKRTGLNLTWDEFKAIYQERKAERDADPVIQSRKERHRVEIDDMDAFFR